MEIILKVNIKTSGDKETIFLSPDTKEEYLKLKKIVKKDSKYTVDISNPRKGNLLRQLQAVTRYLFDNYRGDKPRQIETFRKAITIIVGATEPYRLNGQVLHEQALSWSYKKTDEETFRKRIYNPIMDYSQHYMEHNDRKELLEVSMDYVGYNYDEKKVQI